MIEFIYYLFPLVDCLFVPATCGAIADCLHILFASSLPCIRLAVAVCHPAAYCHRCAALAIVVRRFRCLRRRCPDVSVAPDALAVPPLPPSFVTNPTAVRLRLATVPRQRRRRRRRRRRSGNDRTGDASVTTTTMNDYHTYNDAHNNIIFIKKHGAPWKPRDGTLFHGISP